MSRWSKWRGLEPADRRLLVEAAIFLVLARASFKVLRFRRTAWLFHLESCGQAADETAAAPAIATRPARAVREAAARLPLGATCLPQALAGSAMLRRRQIPTTVHLGVSLEPRGTDVLSAHAWLRCGGTVLIGDSGHQNFTPLAAFEVRPRALLRTVPPGQDRLRYGS